MSLNEKSDEEISNMLDEFGIKHGPIVDSTRKLYEKKLEKAMQSASVKTSSDKTFYREEEEEVTYITYRSPAKHGSFTNMLKQRGNNEQCDGEEEILQQDAAVTYKTANYREVRSSRSRVTGKSGGRTWKVIRALLLLAALGAVLYYAYGFVMNNAQNPFSAQ